MTKKLTIEQCVRDASNNVGLCLSKKYINTKTKMRWKCNNGHIWETAYGNIRGGKWCPYCAGNARLAIKDCYELGIRNGGKCLSKHYKSSGENLLWECGFGHTWCASYNTINQAHWCPHCVGNSKLSIGDAVTNATARGGHCLSREYVNKDSKLLWKCSEGHMWKASFGAIRRGQWCPMCVDHTNSKGQRVLNDILDGLFSTTGVFVKYRGFDWLKMPSGTIKQEIDLFVPQIKLAIEYDGRQHFMPVNFGNISDDDAMKNFERQKYLDRRKNSLIKQHADDVKYFIRFNYKEKITKEHVMKKLKEAGCPIMYR